MQCISQKFSIEMRVNLSSGNAFVTQHFLHCPKVSTTFNQMGGKRMPKGMR